MPAREGRGRHIGPMMYERRGPMRSSRSSPTPPAELGHPFRRGIGLNSAYPTTLPRVAPAFAVNRRRAAVGLSA